MSILEYVEVIKFICSDKHQQPCMMCTRQVELSLYISKHFYIDLKGAFKMLRPDSDLKNYRIPKAKRLVLQLPVIVMKMNLGQCETNCVFSIKANIALCKALLSASCKTPDNSVQISKMSSEKFRNYLKMAGSDDERERLTCLLSEASGLGSSQMKNQYSVTNINRRKDRMNEALRESTEIREGVEMLANLQVNVLKGLGIKSFEVEDSTDEDSTDDDADFEDIIGDDFGHLSDTRCDEFSDDVNDLRCDDVRCDDVSDVRVDDVSDVRFDVNDVRNNNQQYDLYKEVNVNVPYMNPHQLMDLLRELQYNWFAFARVLESNLTLNDEQLNQLLLDFAGLIPMLNLADNEEKLIEQSRQAFLLRNRLVETIHHDIEEIGDTDSDTEITTDELANIHNLLDENGKMVIAKKTLSIRRKARANANKIIAERRFLKRKVGKKTSGILKKFPDIGKTMETYVKESSVGADAWRRTGVLTFDGNVKNNIKPKVTYKRIQSHLQKTYKRKFSYGTVVQLCVARNKRRISSKRYRGVAAITTRRARKGFEVKYNPDHHWSCSFYQGLDILQYTDGRGKANINRDDCSVFRLDAMTSSQHPLPCVTGSAPLTTKTDYTNKYPSNLQTTSYNFTGSETTNEVCVGVVKAQPIHAKNPAQHYADLTFLQTLDNDSIKHSLKGTTECIRVDGGVDEGPGHEEVQLFWTKRHLMKPSRIQLITSRDRGNSNLNRVELQNGMEGRARSGLFIPSTLNGPVTDPDTGNLSTDRLTSNLNAAIDVYIDYVNGAPCSGTGIQLFKGPDSSEEQELGHVFKQWRRGTKAQKEALKVEKKETLNEAIMLWDLRNRHIIDHGPRKYVFHLACCYEEKCIHPLCTQGRPDDMDESMLWFPGGPPLTFLPFPMPDGDRRPGSCPDHECCGGHFLPPREVIEKRLKGVELPPSDVLQRAHTDGSTDPALLSKECTLPVGEVNIWLEHLNNVAANRERGQAKAAETRSLKKKELRTETTPGGAATSTATTHRSSTRSPNHSQAQSAPDNHLEPKAQVDPSQMVVVWSTANATKTSQAILSAGGAGPKITFTGASSQFIDPGTLHHVQYTHYVTFAGLNPGVKYDYIVGSGPENVWSNTSSFSAMKAGTNWSPSIALYGDFGWKNPQSLTRLQGDKKQGMYDAIFHVGDFAYDMATDNGYVGDKFLEQIEPLASELPYMTCPGNHEQLYNFTHYKKHFRMPRDEEANNMFYSFDMGPVHVISLSTEYYFFLQYGFMQFINQYHWLEADLKEANKPENRAKRPWIITMGHRPMYCSNSDKDDCTKFHSWVRDGVPLLDEYGLEDLFCNYGVDLEFWAHEHSYERMWPTYKDKVYNGSTSEPYTNPNAPVHIITGSAGCQENHDGFVPDPRDWSAFRSDDYGYTRMKVYNGTHIYLEQVSDDKGGAIIDKMMLIKDKHTNVCSKK